MGAVCRPVDQTGSMRQLLEQTAVKNVCMAYSRMGGSMEELNSERNRILGTHAIQSRLGGLHRLFQGEKVVAEGRVM